MTLNMYFTCVSSAEQGNIVIKSPPNLALKFFRVTVHVCCTRRNDKQLIIFIFIKQKVKFSGLQNLLP